MGRKGDSKRKSKSGPVSKATNNKNPTVSDVMRGNANSAPLIKADTTPTAGSGKTQKKR